MCSQVLSRPFFNFYLIIFVFLYQNMPCLLKSLEKDLKILNTVSDCMYIEIAGQVSEKCEQIS